MNIQPGTVNVEPDTQNWISAAGLCRMDAQVLDRVGSRSHEAELIAASCVAIALGASVYGYVFGAWRAPLQGLYSAVKLPLLFFSVVLASGLINAMIAQWLGAGLSVRKVCMVMLLAMATASILMGALAPIVAFFTWQAPAPSMALVGLDRADPAAAGATRWYRRLLLMHVAVIGFCGVIGNIRMYRLIRFLTGSDRLALKLLTVWLLIAGFVGCELSWLLSPFICEPTAPPHLVARLYGEFNFYEYVWRALWHL